jgi:hypothetical protein
VAGHRELAPPSKFSKLGGFNSKVFKKSGILHPQCSSVQNKMCKTIPGFALRSAAVRLRSRALLSRV